LEIEDPLSARRGFAACLLHQHSHGIALVEKTKFSVRALEKRKKKQESEEGETAKRKRFTLASAG
jgi:hypothetical protein